jgi:hypothetical protein
VKGQPVFVRTSLHQALNLRFGKSRREAVIRDLTDVVAGVESDYHTQILLLVENVAVGHNLSGCPIAFITFLPGLSHLPEASEGKNESQQNEKVSRLHLRTGNYQGVNIPATIIGPAAITSRNQIGSRFSNYRQVFTSRAQLSPNTLPAIWKGN